jgi:hypothetical protein
MCRSFLSCATHVLHQALTLPHKPPDKRPLNEIATVQKLSMDDISIGLQYSIVQARPSYLPPLPQPEDTPTQTVKL